MHGEFLSDRKKGLEEAFFAEQDAALRRRLRDADTAKAKRDALFAASGIADAAALDELVALGITAETLGLTRTERQLLPQLTTGQGLWKIKDRAFVAQHQLHPAEYELFDTTSRMTDSR